MSTIEDGTSTEITRDHVAMIDPAMLGDKPRVCIFAAFNEAYQPLADIARPNWEAYAEKHNYACRFYPRGFHTDASHPESYGDKNRFNWYFDLKGHCEIVMYLDIDSLFVNMDKEIPFGEYERFLWTFAEGGPMSGLMIARTDAKTERHLRYAYELAARENNVRHGVVEPNGISDQDAMTRLMRVPPFDETFMHCVPAESVGFCYPDTPNPSPWIVTCRGGSLAEKLATMRGLPGHIVGELVPHAPSEDEAADLGRPDNHHPVEAYNPRFEFDRNWVGPADMKPRVYRTQSEKDTWYAVAVENEYCLPTTLLPTDTIIDIGAHIGSFSYLAYRSGSRSVYAYEIDPWHVEAATVNLGDMQDGVALHYSAVVRGDEHRASEYRYDGAWNSFGLTGGVVESKSLDEIINAVCEPGENVRFLKIDCEGGEYPVLYTCTQMDRIEEIAGEWHTMTPGPAELANLPYETNENGLARFLQTCGFDVHITNAGEGNGGFFARRRVALHRGNRYAGAKFGTVVKLS
jgi:FkbM family methyltransferase